MPESESPYALNPDRRGAHMRMISLVPPHTRVLDVGCARGYLAGLLVQKGCSVVGVEIDPAAAAVARNICEVVYEVSAENVGTIPQPPHSFDVALCGDILEHLVHPENALRGMRELLKPDGRVVLSIPNIVFASARMKLLLGKFDYTEDGHFDRTHLRFFSRNSARQLVEAAGFAVVTQDVTQASPLALVGGRLRQRRSQETRLIKTIDAADLWLARRMPGLFGFQHLFVLRPDPTFRGA